MTQATFDKQLQLVREGLDKRAARLAACLACGKAAFKGKWNTKRSRKWWETEGARIQERWGTKIADSLVANRDLYTKFRVLPLSPDVSPDAAPDTLLVWPKAGQINNLLKLAKRWGADEFGTHKVNGQTVVHFWWD